MPGFFCGGLCHNSRPHPEKIRLDTGPGVPGRSTTRSASASGDNSGRRVVVAEAMIINRNGRTKSGLAIRPIS